MESASLHDFLRKVFCCSPDVATSIARRAADRRFPLSTVLLRQGDRAGTTFLLVAGRAHALATGLEGQSVLLHEFISGDFFGAVALAEPSPEEADIVAVEDVRAAVFLALDFLALTEAHGCVGLIVSKALLRQLRSTSTRMLEQVTLTANGRVCVELLRLARAGGGWTVRPAPVHVELADRVHTTRETVSRTINDLERRGIIRRDAKALFIAAPERLEEEIV